MQNFHLNHMVTLSTDLNGSLKMKAHRGIAELNKWASPRGWKFNQAKGGHIKWYHPKIPHPVFTGASPSDRRALKNNIATMTRYEKQYLQ